MSTLCVCRGTNGTTRAGLSVHSSRPATSGRCDQRLSPQPTNTFRTRQPRRGLSTIFFATDHRTRAVLSVASGQIANVVAAGRTRRCAPRNALIPLPNVRDNVERRKTRAIASALPALRQSSATSNHVTFRSCHSAAPFAAHAYDRHAIGFAPTMLLTDCSIRLDLAEYTSAIVAPQQPVSHSNDHSATTLTSTRGACLSSYRTALICST